MKTRKTFLTTALLVFTLSACALDQTQHNTAKFSIPTTSLDMARLIAISSLVECHDKSKCPDPVGMIVSASTDSVSWCTGSLIAPDIMLTNTHCIPSDLQKNGSQCEGRVWLNFPENTANARELIECQEVMTVSFDSSYDLDRLPDDQDPRLDYAFVKMKKITSRKNYSIEGKGFGHGDKVTAFVVDPDKSTKDRMQGKLYEVPCTVDQYTHPRTSRFDDNIFLPKCPIIPGNSGSPLLYDGKVRGVIFAKGGNDALGSNLACVDWPGRQEKMNESCKRK